MSILLFASSTLCYADESLFTFKEEVKSYEQLQQSYLSFVKSQPKDDQDKLNKSFEIIMVAATLLGSEKSDKPELIAKQTISEFVRLTNNKSPSQINELYEKLASNTNIEIFYNMMKESHANNKEKAKELEDKLLGNKEKLPE